MKEVVMAGMAIMAIAHGVIGTTVLVTSRPGYPDKSLGGFLCMTAIILVLLIVAIAIEDS